MIINDQRYQQSTVLPEFTRNYVPTNILSDHCVNSAYHWEHGSHHYVYDQDLVISVTDAGLYRVVYADIDQCFDNLAAAEHALRAELDDMGLIQASFPEYPMIGLNADWCVSTWRVSRHVLIMDNENGTCAFAVVVESDGDNEQDIIDLYNAEPDLYEHADQGHLLVRFIIVETATDIRTMIAAADAVQWRCDAQAERNVMELIHANAQAIHAASVLYPDNNYPVYP